MNIGLNEYVKIIIYIKVWLWRDNIEKNKSFFYIKFKLHQLLKDCEEFIRLGFSFKALF